MLVWRSVRVLSRAIGMGRLLASVGIDSARVG